MAQNIVTTVWKEKMTFESDNPLGNKIILDTSEENGGSSSGVSPKAMMLSSLAGCSGFDIIALLKKMRVEVDDFEMIVKGELTEEHPKYYHTVWVDYHFKGSDLNEDKIEKAVNLSVDKYCGVMEMFRKFAEVNIKTHYHKK